LETECLGSGPWLVKQLVQLAGLEREIRHRGAVGGGHEEGKNLGKVDAGHAAQLRHCRARRGRAAILQPAANTAHT